MNTASTQISLTPDQISREKNIRENIRAAIEPAKQMVHENRLPIDAVENVDPIDSPESIYADDLDARRFASAKIIDEIDMIVERLLAADDYMTWVRNRHFSAPAFLAREACEMVMLRFSALKNAGLPHTMYNDLVDFVKNDDSIKNDALLHIGVDTTNEPEMFSKIIEKQQAGHFIRLYKRDRVMATTNIGFVPVDGCQNFTDEDIHTATIAFIDTINDAGENIIDVINAYREKISFKSADYDTEEEAYAAFTKINIELAALYEVGIDAALAAIYADRDDEPATPAVFHFKY